jgi:hypothetical protein
MDSPRAASRPGVGDNVRLTMRLIALVAVIAVVTALALRCKAEMPSMSRFRAASISSRARTGFADSATYKAASSLAPITT